MSDKAPGDTTGEGFKNVWSVVMLQAMESDPIPAAMMPTPGSATGGKIVLLLPEIKTTRYETADRPDFEERMKELSPNCEIICSTVYKAIKPEAYAPADLAVYLLTNTAVPAEVTQGKTVNNGKIVVLRLGQRVATFDTHVPEPDRVVSAITGAEVGETKEKQDSGKATHQTG